MAGGRWLGEGGQGREESNVVESIGKVCQGHAPHPVSPAPRPPATAPVSNKTGVGKGARQEHSEDGTRVAHTQSETTTKH